MASFIVYGDSSGQVTVAAPSVAGSNTITFPAETGTLITSAYTGTALPGQIAWDTTVKTSGFTAVAYGGYFCNTTSAAFTVTLPATPTRGQFVVIVDYAGTSATNNITVAGNGANINGSGSSATLATNRQGITFTYIDSTQGWLASSNVYGGSTPFTQSYTASYLVVAGGGGGGGGGAGGGAGGYLTGTLTLTGGTTYTAIVGGGGSAGPGAPSNANGGAGSNSTFPGVTTAVGGGYGAGFSKTAGSGGSGGGGAGSAGAAGTPGQGNGGGTGTNGAPYTAGGGGGAGGSGSNFPTGTGGSGTASSITGTPATYAGGGGGGSNSGGGGVAGVGGPGTPGVSGGNGSSNPGTAATVGVANTGGGGGGGTSQNAPNSSGATGGSGVVILSVPTANYSGTVTGTYTTGTSGSNTWIRWTTASGTYTA